MNRWEALYVVAITVVATVLIWAYTVTIHIDHAEVTDTPPCTLYEDGSVYCNSPTGSVPADGSGCIIQEWGCL